MFSRDLTIAKYDADLFAAMEQEAQRQEEHIELIASENYTSPAVMEAQGSVLTNKYAEGYPGKRYYGGCEYVDVVEQLAIDRAKELFGADYANVQPHAGSQANAAVYLALLQGGDTILGMRSPDPRRQRVVLGQTVQRRPIRYRRQRPDRLRRSRAPGSRAQAENDRGRFLRLLADPRLPTFPRHRRQGGCLPVRRHGTRGRPGCRWRLPEPGHVIAAKAICFKEALQPEFKAYQQQVVKNAQAMAEVFIARGFDVVSGGTQNHLFLLSLIKQDISGKDADAALGKAFITVNKNSVPNDPRSPFVTSGLRFGTPAVTTRGFKETECRELAGWICDIRLDLRHPG